MGAMKLTFLGGLSLLWMSERLQLASSQGIGECTASSVDGFDYQVEASTGLSLYWAVNETSEEISFQVEYDGVAYVSVGFSSDGSMIGSDAVIGLPDKSTVLEYSMNNKSVDGVNPTELQELSDTSINQTATKTVMTFTRPLAPSGDDKYTLSPEEGEEAIFIWAYGPDNVLDFHALRGEVILTDILCSDTATIEDEDEDEDEGEDEDEDEDDDAIDVSTAGSECESSDPEYEFEISPTSDLTVFYSVDGSMGTISVKAVYQGDDAWLGIGFSDDGRMPGSDAVVGFTADETILEYDMPSYSTPSEADDQEVTDTTVSQIDGVTTLEFTRPLQPAGAGKKVLALQSTIFWLYAWGAAPFQEHSEKGAFSLTLGTCDFDSVENSIEEEVAHGWLMVLSWAFFFPIGIIFARFSPNFKTVGFKAHWMLQSVGAFLAFAGFFTAVYFTDDLEREHFDNNHAKVGLFLIIFLAFQLAGAVCRPAASSIPGTDAEGLPLPSKPTTTRRVWAVLHRGLGYIAVVLGILNCFSGLEELEESGELEAADTWSVALAVVVLVLLVLFVMLQLLALVRPRPRAASSPERSREHVHLGLS